jgi:hypothetical protein
MEVVTMWPELMGPGWGQQLMMTVGLLGVMVAVLKIMDAAAARLEGGEDPDPLLALWHRYEEGDLTRQEFDRLRAAAAPSPRERGGVPFHGDPTGDSRTALRRLVVRHRGGAGPSRTMSAGG